MVKEILVGILALMIIVSCSKDKKLDREVATEVEQAPVVDRTAVLVAIPVMIEFTELSQDDKEDLGEKYADQIEKYIDLKVQQRKVLFTIFQGLSDETYDPKKLKKLKTKYSDLQKEISRQKINFVNSFVSDIQGKISEESIETGIEKLEKILTDIEVEVEVQESNAENIVE